MPTQPNTPDRHAIGPLPWRAAAPSGEAQDPDAESGAGSLPWLTLTLADTKRLAQVRGLLDDLAKETGGRKQNLDVTSKGERLGNLPDLSGMEAGDLAAEYRKRFGGEPG